MKKILFLCFVGFVGICQASTQSLTITGSVASVCAFTSVNNGIFGFEVQTPHVLDTSLSGGQNASVVLNYNSGPTITVPEITSFSTTPSGFSDTVTFTNTLTASSGSKTYSNGAASWTASTSTSTDTITLRLRAVDGQGNFPVGNYSASTVVTCQ